MIDYDLLIDVSRRIHSQNGTSSAFEKKSSELDIVEALKETGLKLPNTESFFNYIDQNRQSNLKFASFDNDKVRKKNFLMKALTLTEEEIKLSRFDPSFNKYKKIVTFANYIEIIYLLSNIYDEVTKKDILIHLTYLIDSVKSDSLFLQSWIILLKCKILCELKYYSDAKNALDIGKKQYFENFSDYYFTIQTDFGKNYFNEQIMRLENEINNNLYTS